MVKKVNTMFALVLRFCLATIKLVKPCSPGTFENGSIICCRAIVAVPFYFHTDAEHVDYTTYALSFCRPNRTQYIANSSRQ